MHKSRWQKFYNNIKDQSWPECWHESQLHLLPTDIQQEIHWHMRDIPNLLDLTDHDITRPAQSLARLMSIQSKCTDQLQEDFKQYFLSSDTWLYYKDQMSRVWWDQTHAEFDSALNEEQEIPKILRYLRPGKVFEHCLDWCAGAGFIGFRLLSDGLCNRLTLLEKFAPAVDACKMTINDLPPRFAGRCDVIQSDSVTAISGKVKFDLIVGNPPFYGGNFIVPKDWQGMITDPNVARLTCDFNWKAHNDFFANIAHNLSEDGIIILEKSDPYSAQDFEQRALAGGLKIVDSFKLNYFPTIWYMVLSK